MLDIKLEQVAVGASQLLKNIDLSLATGQFVAIIGENGAGKSSLLKTLSGDLIGDGAVALNGQPLELLHPAELAPIRAVMEQQLSAPFGLSVNELVAMGRFCSKDTESQAEARAMQWLKRFDLMPMANRAINLLSGGERQRAHLARCFCQLEAGQEGQQLLLLDEPTSALDVYHQHSVLHEIKCFTERGNLALAVMHDLNLASLYADKVILLSQGELIQYSSPEDVLCSEVLEQAYRTPVHVSLHPSLLKPMIFTEPQKDNL